MAWKKWGNNYRSGKSRFPWRRQSQKRISVKRLPRTVARKRTDWVSLFNDTGELGAANQGCQIRCVEFGGTYCDEPSVRIAVMPQAAVAALYDDDVTIAKMRGFINFHPMWLTPNGCDTIGWLTRMYGEQWPIYLRAGLYKQELTDEQGGIPPFVNPNVAHDWNDVYALKRWQHIWQPRGRHSVTWQQPTKIIGVCSDVQQNSYIVPASASGNQDPYSVPELETFCSARAVGNGEGACNVSDLHFERENPAWYRMSLNRSKPIRLHENDSLDLFLNFSMPRISQSCVDACQDIEDGDNPCAMKFSIQLDVQLQFG